jgi:hypothetical protein
MSDASKGRRGQVIASTLSHTLLSHTHSTLSHTLSHTDQVRFLPDILDTFSLA